MSILITIIITKITNFCSKTYLEIILPKAEILNLKITYILLMSRGQRGLFIWQCADAAILFSLIPRCLDENEKEKEKKQKSRNRK